MLIHGEEHMGYGKVAFVCGTPLQVSYPRLKLLGFLSRDSNFSM